MCALLALALAAAASPTSTPDAGAPPDPEWSNHVVRKARVRAYDPSCDRLVLVVGNSEVTLKTGQATVYGRIATGRIVDVSWEHDTRSATFVVVRPDRLRAARRP